LLLDLVSTDFKEGTETGEQNSLRTTLRSSEDERVAGDQFENLVSDEHEELPDEGKRDELREK